MIEQLDSMDTPELKALARRIEGVLKVRTTKARDEAIARIQALAAEAGLDVSVAPAGEGAKARAPVPVRYRHPEDPGKTWSGRGRAPKWLAALEGAGRHRDEFKVAA